MTQQLLNNKRYIFLLKIDNWVTPKCPEFWNQMSSFLSFCVWYISKYKTLMNAFLGISVFKYEIWKKIKLDFLKNCI